MGAAVAGVSRKRWAGRIESTHRSRSMDRALSTAGWGDADPDGSASLATPPSMPR